MNKWFVVTVAGLLFALCLAAPAMADDLRLDDTLIVKVANKLNKSRRLSSGDVKRYQDIFKAQAAGDFVTANKLITDLKDHRLIGHVLFERYLHKDYKAGYDELAAWTRRFGDHPGAQQIFDMALARKPKKGGASLVEPKNTRGIVGIYDVDVGPAAQSALDSGRLSPRGRDILKAVNAVMADRPTQAMKRLNAKDVQKALSDVEYDVIRADIATAYFFNGKTDEALSLAAASLNRSGAEVPQAGWIAGLAAWKKGDYKKAAGYFEIAAASPRASAWMASAASYWAARSWLRGRVPEKVSPWLVKAADYPRSFYGIIALKALGMEQTRFNWKLPALEDSHIKDLSKIPGGRRAIALVDVNRPDLAALELKQLNPAGDEDIEEAMLAFAATSGLPEVLIRLGGRFKDDDDALYDGALYPDMSWEPEAGYIVDRALVYAFIRQESQFAPNAANRGSGAVGLMQLMPSTAKHISGQEKTAADLRDPVQNVELGQKYLQELLGLGGIKNNLFRLALAYNAGPGKLARFQQAWSSGEDPLLFIESFPVAETRMFVERVLTNYWIYRIKHGQPTDSLDAVARGDWPLYVPPDAE